MRILLLQGQVAEAAATLSLLRAAGGVADHLCAGAEASAWLETYDYDLIVLDHALADGSGTDLLRQLRAEGFSEPVLMLAGPDAGTRRAQLLRLGADDLLAKPYDGDELLACAEALVRRRHGFACSMLRIGKLGLDISSRTVLVEDRPLPLTAKEYGVLELMAMRRGRVITKQHFLDHLYGSIDAPETRVVDVFVCNVRRKLAGHGLGAMIDTVRGHGYVLRGTAQYDKQAGGTFGGAAEVITFPQHCVPQHNAPRCNAPQCNTRARPAPAGERMAAQ